MVTPTWSSARYQIGMVTVPSKTINAYCDDGAESQMRTNRPSSDGSGQPELPGLAAPLGDYRLAFRRLATLSATVKAMDLTTMRPYRAVHGPVPTSSQHLGDPPVPRVWLVGDSRVTVNGHRYTARGGPGRMAGNGPTFWVAPRGPLARGGELTYYVNGASLKAASRKLNASGWACRRRAEGCQSRRHFRQDMFALILAAGVTSAI